jgi:hypothetical protein
LSALLVRVASVSPPANTGSAARATTSLRTDVGVGGSPIQFEFCGMYPINEAKHDVFVGQTECTIDNFFSDMFHLGSRLAAEHSNLTRYQSRVTRPFGRDLLYLIVF